MRKWDKQLLWKRILLTSLSISGVLCIIVILVTLWVSEFEVFIKGVVSSIIVLGPQFIVFRYIDEIITDDDDD